MYRILSTFTTIQWSHGAVRNVKSKQKKSTAVCQWECNCATVASIYLILYERTVLRINQIQFNATHSTSEYIRIQRSGRRATDPIYVTTNN